METQAEVLMEVHVRLAAEEESQGAGDEGTVFGDKACKDLALVTMAEEKEVLTEEIVQTEIEKCTQELRILAANDNGDGDGDGDGKVLDDVIDENGMTPLSASQAVVSELLCTEVTPEELRVTKEQEGCNGDGDGKNAAMSGGDGEAAAMSDGNGKAVAMDETSLAPEFIPVLEDNEPARSKISDDAPVEPPIASPRPPKRPRYAPECEEVDNIVQTMRNILFNLTYEDDAHLNPEDEAKVRDLLEYHPKAQEKIGSGIEFIKIKRHDTFKDVRCFWVVRTDGTEIDFSYHKCLKEKVAKENPNFVDRYDAVYRCKRSRAV